MDEQPLRKRAAWRHQRRPVQGEKRTVPLSDQTEQGAQIDPQAPLGLSEWDGNQCVPAGAAEDLPAAAAQTGERLPLPCCCYERRSAVVNAFFDLADTITTVRSLIRRAWTTHRWDTRPRRCP